MKVSLCNAILDMTVQEKKDRNGQRSFLSGLFTLSIAPFMHHTKALVLLCVITVIAISFSASSVTDDVYVIWLNCQFKYLTGN